MIGALQPYHAMKDSGTPWLGKVPEHWKITRMKSAVLQINEQTAEKQPKDVYVALENVEGWTGQVRLLESTASFDSHVKKFRRDDVLFGKLRPYLAKVARLPVDGVCVGEFFVLRPRSSDVLPQFLEIMLRSNPIIDVINSSTFGAKMPRADWDFFGNVIVSLPPPPEQAAIVRFLDYANQSIRGYLKAKLKLIRLLEEQKQAIINRAVTSGLDPAVRLKPSGADWLTHVPEHWEMLRTKYLFREIDDRSVFGKETHLSMSQKLGLVPNSMVEQSALMSESYAGGKLCEADDIVLNRLKAHLGVFALVSQSGVVSPDYTVFRKIRPLSMRFYEYLLRSPAFRTELRIRAKGIVEGFWRLYTDDFYNIRVPVPPTEEQEKIVIAIQTSTKSIDAIIARTERETALLRDYRLRMIADVVTGKLDVREAAANLPDEVAEIETPDDANTFTERDEDTVESQVEALAEEAEA